MLPNLFVAGASKSGTTTLYHYLNQHPEIFMCPIKEPHFFTDHNNLTMPLFYPKDLKRYESLFQEVRHEHIIGEASPSYMHSHQAIERIKKDTKNPKFIFTLRNPIDRTYSYYKMLIRQDKKIGNFEQKFSTDMIEHHNKHPYHDIKNNIYTTCHYDYWIMQYAESFGIENIHIMIFERWVENPVEQLNKAFSFLRVEPLKALEKQHHNKGQTYINGTTYNALKKRWHLTQNNLFGKCLKTCGIKFLIKTFFDNRLEPYPELTSESRNYLAKHYKNNVNNLRNILGRSLPEWEADFPAQK